MKIRKAKTEDLPRLEEIYSYARKFMAENNNPNQWKNITPRVSVLENDIKNGELYVLEDKGEVIASFMLTFLPDPTYSYIEGEWLNDEEYATIHRIANIRPCKVLKQAIEYAFKYTSNVRIDTHEDNSVMRKALAKYGFTYVGIIYIADKSKRLAFQKKN